MALHFLQRLPRTLSDEEVMSCVKALGQKLYFKMYQSESGQVAIEYILVLMVSVAIILGALYQLNDAFRVWADSYFGDYLACLLETGELPSLDGGAGTCNSSYKAFSLSDGRQLVTSSNESSGAEGGSGTGGGGAGGVSGGGGGAQSASGQSSFISMGASNARFNSPTRFSAHSKGGGGGASDEKGGGGSDTGAFGATDLAGYQQGRVIRIPLRQSQQIAGSRSGRDEDKKDQAKIKVAVSEQGAAQQKRNELMRIERKTASSKAPEIEEFTFGNFLRYIIMAAIIIAILFFIGGQALQVSKSLE